MAKNEKAVALGKLRWAGTTKKERQDYMDALRLERNLKYGWGAKKCKAQASKKINDDIEKLNP